MHIFLSLFIFMFASSLLMVGYVLIRDIKHKKSQPAEVADADAGLFEEIQTPETALAEYTDLRKKTA